MIWILILLLILSIVFSYFLFAPFFLEIDSSSGLYGIRFHRLATARLLFTPSSIIIDIRIAGWSKQFDPFEDEHKKDNPRPVKKKKNRMNFSFNLLMELIRSFKINKCYVTIDSGNMQMNGILYPGFYWLSRQTCKTININFQDKNIFILEIENNFARIIKTFIFHLFINKKKYGQLK